MDNDILKAREEAINNKRRTLTEDYYDTVVKRSPLYKKINDVIGENASFSESQDIIKKL